ncbi:hypothetical protein B0I73DRAFT_164835 [Yarrowia lipolytica]|uniref:Uncharacterized protein n=1 Tax=Yarrowia lipolytica TaxID=4952 RepID=A0A371CDD4_YARLL|nr:hypothetical protein B0I71DRAFT_167940 [Yarrowia lipolytica]RDW42307.1 hypothetical protein B0I73DRAFT_164835 [Yarrowia lipolytica]
MSTQNSFIHHRHTYLYTLSPSFSQDPEPRSTLTQYVYKDGHRYQDRNDIKSKSLIAMKFFPVALLAATATASLCVDYQAENDQVLLAVQPCEESVTAAESEMSIFIRAAAGQPEAILAESLKKKLDIGDFAGYLRTKLSFDTDERPVNVASAFAIVPEVELKSIKKYEIQNPYSLQKRGECSMWSPGNCGLSDVQTNYYSNFYTVHADPNHQVCLGICTDYLSHIWNDGVLQGSFYYTYNGCKFRSQNNWNGKTWNFCRVGAFYVMTKYAIFPTLYAIELTGWVDGVNYVSPRFYSMEVRARVTPYLTEDVDILGEK